MIIQLSEAELEVAVNQYLVAEGMDLSNKITTFQFDGTCSMDIEVDQDAVATPKAKTTRAKRKPKAPVAKKPEVNEEPIEAKEDTVEYREETVPVADVVQTLSMDAGMQPEVMDDDGVDTVAEEPAAPTPASIFG